MGRARVLIVGSGQGGFQVAASLRDEGFDGPIAIIGEEPGLPYQRPPLSKAYLTGKAHEEQVRLRPASFYESRNIELLVPERALSIARDQQLVKLESGHRLEYKHLVLATGARPRRIRVVGVELDGVFTLRCLAEAEAIRTGLESATNIVIIGAGFIGLEIAAVARAMGLTTHIIDFAERPLKRSVSAKTGNFLTEAHTEQGVQFHFMTAISEITGADGRVTGVATTDGRHFPADLVVIGIGVEPNVELARDAGLKIDNGIVVDRQLLTADPSISAIGDSANYPTDFFPHPVRIESVQNAVDQARCVAARLAGKPAPYRKVPWFWSDQGQYKLQIAGVAQEGDDAVVRGDMASGKFSVFRFRDGRLSCVESVNQAADHLAARKLIEKSTQLSSEQAGDSTISLSQLAA
ncbi:NAD(P)/FAD-dependent oxidoreductase [Noviherbaspirillum pedocola]|uniref:FAD-dependent oxidoreductase n=1 Tax=Noviherbaspirillum pedocola TaxID=2801341 RepID=A0A934T3K5_9BURK|nr:FAD-dependent oxidoreductase [Noviherbaspirillum pedocola]MBK4739352.1 FAD-dependent oxidoreductase [Noviherbaspirillum pedocola]